MKNSVLNRIKETKNCMTAQINVAHAEAMTLPERALHMYGKTTKLLIFAMLLMVFTCVPCFADVTTAELGDTEIITNMIGIVLLVFRVIGIVMVVYSIGALILAFKNEDPDSKTKNTSMMVISIVLIFLETFVNASGILDHLA